MSRMLLSADPFEIFGYVSQGSRSLASACPGVSGSFRPYRTFSYVSIYAREHLQPKTSQKREWGYQINATRRSLKKYREILRSKESSMAKRDDSILDDLARYPWWVNVILAVIVYFSLKYWIPTIEFQNPFYAGIAKGAHVLAPTLAGILLLPAAVSAINSWRKGRLLEKQK